MGGKCIQIDRSCDTMSIRVLFFARAREVTETNEYELNLPRQVGDWDVLSVPQVVKILEDQFCGLKELRGAYALAVNEEYVEACDRVRAGDVVALIPPISGG